MEIFFPSSFICEYTGAEHSARRHTVDIDAILPKFPGYRLGHGHHTGLGRRIVTVHTDTFWTFAQVGCRGDKHDLALDLVGHHVSGGSLPQEVAALQICIHDPVVHILRQIQIGIAGPPCRTGDQHIQPAIGM